MSNVKQIELNNVFYPAKDEAGRTLISKIFADITGEFSIDASYAVGKLVLYDGNLYKCNTSHSGSWNAAHFTSVTFESLLNSITQTMSLLPFVTSDNGNRNAGFHASLYRGKNLGSGSSALSALYSGIGASTFDDQFVGDYITLNGHTYILTHPNYWLNFGDTMCSTPHWLVVPASSSLVSGKMNSMNITTGAYIGCDYYTGANDNTAKEQIEGIIKTDFGSAHILTHREYLKNAVTNGFESAGAWYDSQIELMTEEMVYGGKEFKNITAGTNIPAGYTIDHSQLALFRYRRDTICTRGDWWLRDVVSSALFAGVYYNGVASGSGASLSLGIRPAFGIIA